MLTDIQNIWTLEFLLRQPTTDYNHIKCLLPLLLQTSTQNPRLTKTLLLKQILSDVSAGVISGRIAQALELIKQIDENAGAPVLDSLKDAYCAVAFHCTCDLLKHNNDQEFHKQIKIWRENVRHMHNGKHVSLDSYVPPPRGDSSEGDTRDSALNFVKSFLEQSTAEMGPPFLELAAERVLSRNNTIEVDPTPNNDDQLGVPMRNHERFAAATAVSDTAGTCSEEESDVSTKKGKTVLTPKFRQVREALQSSMVDLHDVVIDPLPDALAMAAGISRDMERHGVNDTQSMVNQNVPSTGNQSEAHVDKFVDKECQVVHAKDGNARNSRPSLMERNCTAQTLEWDESPSSSRPHLPTPNTINVSPLSRQVVRNKGGRRKQKRWSSLEEQTLIDAVKEYGRGNWTTILAEYREIFEERTSGDLKDKWRNLTK